MHSLELENETTLVNTSWDGFWRIILLDLPENRKSERKFALPFEKSGLCLFKKFCLDFPLTLLNICLRI